MLIWQTRPAGQSEVEEQDCSLVQPILASFGFPEYPWLQMQFMLWLSVTQNEFGPQDACEHGSTQNFSTVLWNEEQISL